MCPVPGTHRTCRTACSCLRAHPWTRRASCRQPSGCRKPPGRHVSCPYDCACFLHVLRRVLSSRHAIWTFNCGPPPWNTFQHAFHVPDMLGRHPNAASCSCDHAAHFPCQKTCPSHRTRLPDVLDIASTRPSNPRPFQTMGSSPSPSPLPEAHFPCPTTPRAYLDLQICLWASG